MVLLQRGRALQPNHTNTSVLRQCDAGVRIQKQAHLLQTLPEIDRTAFVLRVQHELPYAEIARVLGLSPAAVKVKVHRAWVKLLRDRLSEEVT